jgi:CheY-like chemotaxis protein
MEKFKVLLIDDDPTYRAIMRKCAENISEVDLSAYGSLVEMGSVCCLGKYDVIIVDFDLGLISGNDVATYLDSFFGSSIPMLLISSVNREPSLKGTILEGARFSLKTTDHAQVIRDAVALIQTSVAVPVEKALSL